MNTKTLEKYQAKIARVKQFCARRHRIIKIAIQISTAIIFALLLFAFRDIESWDMSLCLTPWWDYIKEHGFRGISSIYADNIGIFGADYPSIYYFLIYLFAQLPELSSILGVKLISALFSVFAAIMVYFIIKHFRPKAAFLPSVIAAVSLFLPMAFLNTVMVGQCDIIYSSFIIAGFLAAIKDRPWIAFAMFGASISFKMMAVFFVPFLLYWVARNWKRWGIKQRLAPIASLISIVIISIPGFLAGNTIINVLEIYLSRMSTASKFDTLAIGGVGVPNIWQVYNHIEIKYVAIVLAGVLTIAILFFIWRFVRPNKKASAAGLDYQLLILSTMTVLPYTLPFMLDRYMFLAAFFSLIFLAINPRKEFFIIFLILNYATFWTDDIYRWFIPIFGFESGLIAPPICLVAMVGGLVIYMLYLLYANSTLYKGRPQNATPK